MWLGCTKYCFFFSLFTLFYNSSFPQLASSSFGRPFNYIVNVTFGAGNYYNAGVAGPPLSEGFTHFSYTSSFCPPEGYYTIVTRNNIRSCFDSTWANITTDHTLSDDHGYMMVVNDTATPYNKILFADTVHKPTCTNNVYEFSAAILNIDKPGYCHTGTERYPSFIFSVEDLSGQVLHAYATRKIPFGGSFKPSDYGSSVYGFDFTMPAGITDYVIKIIDSSAGAGGCGYAFVVDDIHLISLGPDMNIKLDNFPNNYIQTSTCFQDHKTISLTGDNDINYVIPAVQWQQSRDNGITWTDIGGATDYHFTTPPLSEPDTFLLRLRGDEDYNIQNPFCGTVSNTIKVQVDGIPKDFLFTSNSPVCTDSDLIFTLQGGASYITTGPQGFFDNSPFPHISYPKIANNGVYYAQIVSLGGCKIMDSTKVKIIGPDVKVSPDESICFGKPAQLLASGGQIYLWSPADGLSNITIANPIASPANSIIYTVKVTDQTGCSSRGKITIHLLDSILRAGIAGPQVVCPRDIAHFNDSSQGVIRLWAWEFGNGKTSTDKNPPEQVFQVYDRVKDFTVQLVVTDTAGCMDTAYHMIKSVNNCYIDVPSAFTPNNDGLNDYLYPLNAYKATHLIFSVFNRAGELVFQTSDWTKKWDGNFRGMPQPMGTYVWILEYLDANKNKVFLKGTSVLVR